MLPAQVTISTEEAAASPISRSEMGRAGLPCLNSNKCISTPLKSAHKKTEYVLQETVKKFVEKHGINHVGMLTLTFADHVVDKEVAQKRWHSLRTNVISKRYGDHWIRVPERQRSSRLHIHVLVAMRPDIRTGCDFAEFEQRRYSTAGPELRREWAFWRRTAPAYRFGRTELLPIKSNSEGLGKYLGKYIGKNIASRLPIDKGMRLMAVSKPDRVGTANFAWNSQGAKLWRAKLAQWAFDHGCFSYEEIKAKYGRNWAFHARDEIMRTEVPDYVHPSQEAAEKYFQSCNSFKRECEVEVILDRMKKVRENDKSKEADKHHSSRIAHGVHLLGRFPVRALGIG